jgi:dnd system-associated protein 4
MSRSKLYPRDIDLEGGEKHSKVLKLTEDSSSPFYKKTMKQVFMYALGIGFKNKKRVPLKKRVGVIPLSAFNDADLSIIKSIAIADKKNIDIMFGENIQEMFKIAEEYANGGIELLDYQVFGPEPGDPDKKMEQALRDIPSVTDQGDQ